MDFKNFPTTDKEIKALVQQSCDVNDSLKLNNKLKAIQKHLTKVILGELINLSVNKNDGFE